MFQERGSCKAPVPEPGLQSPVNPWLSPFLTLAIGGPLFAVRYMIWHPPKQRKREWQLRGSFAPIDDDGLPGEKGALQARNRIVSVISCGVAARLAGTLSRKFAFLSPPPVKRLSISVSTGTGATALTRTPLAAPSSAAARLRR